MRSRGCGVSLLALLVAAPAAAVAVDAPPAGGVGGTASGDAPRANPEPPDAQSLLSVITGASTCPTPDAVWTELGTLVPRDRLEARLRALAGEAARVEIEDHGVPYRVIAGGRVREYRDETRDCAYRARIAAVFVALAIDPAEIHATDSTPPPVAAAAPIEPEAPRPLLRLDVGAALDAGVGPSDRVAQGGAAIRFAVGRGPVAVVAGVLVLVPVDTAVGGVRLHQQRYPADVAARVSLGHSRFEPYGELGVLVAWVSERGLDLVSPRSASSFEIGARGALGVRLPLRPRLSLFGALHAAIVPTPPEVFALPRGVAGHTPYLWVGATLGASMGLL